MRDTVFHTYDKDNLCCTKIYSSELLRRPILSLIHFPLSPFRRNLSACL